MFLCLICIRIFGLEGVIRLNQYADDAFIDEHLLYNLILRQCDPSVIWVNDMESPFPINFFQNNEVSRIKIKNGRKRHPTDVMLTATLLNPISVHMVDISLIVQPIRDNSQNDFNVCNEYLFP